MDLIAFCTKNPAPMLDHMEQLTPYGQYWFVTITPYGKDIEPNVPEKEKIIEDFQRLSETVGVDSVGWRYDPIFVDSDHSVKWHIRNCEGISYNNKTLRRRKRVRKIWCRLFRMYDDQHF